MKRIVLCSLLLALCALPVVAQDRSHSHDSITRRASRVRIDNAGEVKIEPRPDKGLKVTRPITTTTINFCADAGSTDSYACSLAPTIAAYTTGQVVSFKANTANTGAATLNLNSLGAKTIKKVAGGITTDLATNDIRAGQYVQAQYDGTNFQMLSAIGNADGGGTVTSVSGTTNQIDVATETTTPVLSISATAVAPGTLEVTTSLTVGSGTALTRLAYYTATISPVEVGANTCAEELFAVTGITAGDVVFVNKPTAQAGLGLGGVRASAADQVGINFCNNTASPITPTASQSYVFGVIR